MLRPACRRGFPLRDPKGSFGFPQIAAGTRDLAWRGSGLWLSSSIDQPPRRVYPLRTGQVQWASDGSHVLFTADRSLYIARRPEFEPILVAEIGATSSAIWVVP
jgi:hypothetical protein